MKKVFVVSKTHLDLGFTDYAANIKKKYINEFIPGAISLAEKVNTDKEKNFIWTTGSWIIKEALEKGTDEQKKNLEKAICDGNIVPHAMPFTTHTELLDEDTLDYGLSIVDKLDELRGRKTVAAKMTDVPGHTRSLVKALHAHGIKLLHIGVNGASAVPEVPDCFLWKSGDSEVVVVYSKDYGGAYKSDVVDEVLYFDHTLDNHGAPPPERTMQKINAIKKEFPDYEVTAGTLDDFAEVIWEKRNELPVLENEIGDTWIHGSASDPFKSASLREMMALKEKWLADGSMVRGSDEYINFTDSILCVAEHTCGVDMKIFFADYNNYLKKQFNKARKKDTVSVGNIFYPHNFINWIGRTFGNNRKGSYKAIEKSWKEQRGYIFAAVEALSPDHKAEAEKALKWLRPEELEQPTNGSGSPYKEYTCGNWTMQINSLGGIKKLSFDGENVIRDNDEAIIEYHSYSDKDYDFWIENYTRDLAKTAGWSIPDFARPNLKKVSGKYPVGRFKYTVDTASVCEENSDVKIYVNLRCDEKLCNELGAPRNMQVVYTLTESGVKFDVLWTDKDANRLTEALFLRLYPANGKLTLKKIGEEIDPMTVASKGSRNLHAVRNVHLKTDSGDFRIINRHSPIVSVGRGKILEFDNKFEDFTKDGISFVLHDNVWGTNFPIWYEDNARFGFEITNYYLKGEK